MDSARRTALTSVAKEARDSLTALIDGLESFPTLQGPSAAELDERIERAGVDALHFLNAIPTLGV